MIQFYLMAVVAFWAENALFTRSLGSSWLLPMIRAPKRMAVFGLFLVGTTTLSSLSSWFVEKGLRTLEGVNLYLLRSVANLTVILVICALLCMIFRAAAPGIFHKLEKIIVASCFNYAVLGTILLSINRADSLPAHLGYGFGSALGFIFAMWTVSVGEQHLAVSRVPKSFRGLPITLVYIGLLSLAIYGMTGHQLPT